MTRSVRRPMSSVAVLLLPLLAALTIYADRAAAAPTMNPAQTYVQLFRWRWNDIARECTGFLGPKGFGAVQISPPAAHKAGSAWWDVYQPVNYRSLTSDMGTPSELSAMIAACHKAGVRVYADVVLNHMAADRGTATDGSAYDGGALKYPFYSAQDFHGPCDIRGPDYSGDRGHVVGCRLVGLPDLATDGSYVRQQASEYLKSLRELGIDGFRIDAAKHMWPADIQAILAQVPKTTLLGEPLFITQEIIPDGSVQRADYLGNGTINEFQFTYAVRDTFRGRGGLGIAQLPGIMGTGNGGGSWGLVASDQATVFVDNHDTERHPDDSLNLSSDNNKRFDLANVYMLTQPYGKAQLQSGYTFPFWNVDQDSPTASPYDASGDAIIMKDWDFVHRWADLYPLVAFRNATAGKPMVGVQTGNANQLAYGRGAAGKPAVGFVALNNDPSAWTRSFSTGLPSGLYCNVAHGLLNDTGTGCTGDTVRVDGSGNATITVGPVGGARVPAVVLYANQKVPSTCTSGFCPSHVPVDVDPARLVRGSSVVLYYAGGLSNGAVLQVHYGVDGWKTVANERMTRRADGYWESPPISLSGSVSELDFVFTDGAGAWDNNGGADWRLAVGDGGACATVPVTFTIAGAGTAMGQDLYVVGNLLPLGSWSPATAFALAIQGAGADARWSGTVKLPPGRAFQYKYVKYDRATGAAVWEADPPTASRNRERTTGACNAPSHFDDGSFRR